MVPYGLKFSEYKSLTKEEKEEYDFRFRDGDIVRKQWFVVSGATSFFFAASYFLLLGVVVLSNKELFPDHRFLVTSLLTMVRSLLVGTVIVIGIFCAYYAIRSIMFIVSFNRWKKSTKVKKNEGR